LFPVDLERETTLEPDFLSKAPDVSVAEHPIFRLFGKGESPLLSSVKIEKYLSVVNPNVNTSGSYQTLATLRNGQPLVVEKQFGKGKTIAFLTTADPLWNNWGRGNPSFVVVMLELAASLARRPQGKDMFIVGETLPPEITVNANTAGIYDYEPAATEANKAPAAAGRRLIAVNVNPSEGDTRLSEVSELTAALQPAGQSIESAAGFSTSFNFTGEQPLSDFLLLLTAFFLMGETFLAGRILPPVKHPKSFSHRN
jgi:hypothetical protein